MEKGTQIRLPLVTLTNPSLKRALSEVSNPFHRQDIAPLHCMLAVEAVRAAFDDENGKTKGGRRCVMPYLFEDRHEKKSRGFRIHRGMEATRSSHVQSASDVRP